MQCSHSETRSEPSDQSQLTAVGLQSPRSHICKNPALLLWKYHLKGTITVTASCRTKNHSSSQPPIKGLDFLRQCNTLPLADL